MIHVNVHNVRQFLILEESKGPSAPAQELRQQIIRAGEPYWSKIGDCLAISTQMAKEEADRLVREIESRPGDVTWNDVAEYLDLITSK